MKFNLSFAILALCFVSCAKELKKESAPALQSVSSLIVPSNTIDKSKLTYDNKTSQWSLETELFSGYATSNYKDGSPMQKFGILNGKQQNEATDWFPDGQLKQLANYHEGRLHGEKKNWIVDSSHVLISHLNYHLGKPHGVQKKWYQTGQIFKILNLEMGREEGIQQAFRKNGDLYANYEAKNGRIFGLKKAALCFGVEDEIIQK